MANFLLNALQSFKCTESEKSGDSFKSEKQFSCSFASSFVDLSSVIHTVPLKVGKSSD